ncbi:hypothetical protein LEMLEM_LOCUS21784 [Lemmus lemmus]
MCKFGVSGDVWWSLMELESRWQYPVMVRLESMFHVTPMPAPALLSVISLPVVTVLHGQAWSAVV